MTKFYNAAAAAMFVIGSSAASAATVDFEDEAPLVSDPLSVGTSYSNGGINFTSTEDMMLVGVGGGTGGFVPGDNPIPAGAFDEIFLTGDFDNNTDMKLSFGSDLSAISFDIADIDGGSGSSKEVFTFDFLHNSAVVHTIVVDALDPLAGDALVTNISFSGLFDEVSITGVTSGGTRNIGWGIDNIAFTAVPVPASLPLLLVGVGGLGLMRRIKRKS